MSRKKVILGLSGGVDSAVAALRLQGEGYEVTAVRLRIYDGPDLGPGAALGGCYGRRDTEDTASARDLAESLGLPFRVLDCSELWRKLVLDHFRAQYLAGLTPNPCVRCNQLVKFGLLPELARRAGLRFDYLATGHYARLSRPRPDGPLYLRRGRDLQKDQSYFLYRLSQRQLARVLFPLGEMTKPEVRRLAGERGLAVVRRAESQDFYGGDYAELLRQPDREGAVVDSAGRVLGRHRGFWRFTPGQRRGLGVSSPVPLYVLRLIPERNEVVAGPAGENAFPGCRIVSPRFPGSEPPLGAELTAKIRSSQDPVAVTVAGRDERSLTVAFQTPVGGLAPGQSLVLYRDDLVVGGGFIARD